MNAKELYSAYSCLETYKEGGGSYARITGSRSD